MSLDSRKAMTIADALPAAARRLDCVLLVAAKYNSPITITTEMMKITNIEEATLPARWPVKKEDSAVISAKRLGPIGSIEA